TTGTLINREEYYPFGETSFGGFQYKRYRYNGKEKDAESGLYEYGQRYYAPWLCRFVSVDPVAESFPYYTSYNYAGNKPISKVDMEGLQESDAPQMQTLEHRNSASSGRVTTLEQRGQPEVNLVLINAGEPEIHQVKKGETISGLAKEYGVSQDAI